MGHVLTLSDVPLCPLCGDEGPLFPTQTVDAAGDVVPVDTCALCAGYASLAAAVAITQDLITDEPDPLGPWADVARAWAKVAGAQQAAREAWAAIDHASAQARALDDLVAVLTSQAASREQEVKQAQHAALAGA